MVRVSVRQKNYCCTGVWNFKKFAENKKTFKLFGDFVALLRKILIYLIFKQIQKQKLYVKIFLSFILSCM